MGADPAMGIASGDFPLRRSSIRRNASSQRGEDDATPTILQQFCIAWEIISTNYVIVENNSHGILTCTRLIKDLAYPNAYLETRSTRLPSVKP